MQFAEVVGGSCPSFAPEGAKDGHAPVAFAMISFATFAGTSA
jgi:hypothetical protein